ncbi:hypothetical protein [Fimbriiglobus ruber]|uniref:Uncharacterized protein n=1 Tax=Fimbriiglobus ruber TaxID=1908690 RepID=A0A225EAP4_9BACT|nr:hypothetical protein [Fimbriiglobus ruber]OWK45625.1 hypothetical protein FRUB_01956 [Fimbriiglobus ruber]
MQQQLVDAIAAGDAVGVMAAIAAGADVNQPYKYHLIDCSQPRVYYSRGQK